MSLARLTVLRNQDGRNTIILSLPKEASNALYRPKGNWMPLALLDFKLLQEIIVILIQQQWTHTGQFIILIWHHK